MSVAATQPFPIDDVRQRFPSLAAAGDFIFFDNAAGAQVPDTVVQAVGDHLLTRNVQRGGPYRRSREVDAMIERTRASVAAFVGATGAGSGDEIAFGLNATSFIRAISLAVGQTLDARPEIVVSEIDHEANIATWLALERNGARIVWWRARDDGRVHAADLESLVGRRTRIVACTVATNATGTIVDVVEAARVAHAAGAEIFLDAVHYAPHGPVDVRRFDCDYLVCSGYKVFAPHMGFAWCRPEAIDRLPTFREHFIPDAMPGKLEAGTYGYESVAGMDAAIGYLEALGEGNAATPRSERLRIAMTRVADYERALSARMLDALESIPGVTVHGVSDRRRLAERVPTFAFSVAGVPAARIADDLAQQEIGLRSGHMYAPRLLARLNLAEQAVVRASLVHYNTIAEIDRFHDALTTVIAHAKTA